MKLTPDQIQILKDGKIKGNKFYLVGQLDRKQYTSINEVLETIGLKWTRKEKAHIADCTADELTEAIDDIIETGEVETLKDTIKKFQYYPTPHEVAEYLVELADIQKNDDILEPSAGEGHIVDCILHKIKDSDRLYCQIDLVELDIEKVKILKEKYGCFSGMKDGGDGLHTHSDSHKMNVFLGDFLENGCNPNAYDKVIANPPFSKSQDVEHILKMYYHLKKGGTLVSVASSSIRTRQGKLYDELQALNPEYHDLPEGSFKESGTMVNTVIVKITK